MPHVVSFKFTPAPPTNFIPHVVISFKKEQYTEVNPIKDNPIP